MPNRPQETHSPTFTTSPYQRRLEKPWGWELHWTPPGPHFLGKLLHINAGCRLSLQVHESKSEAWLLLSGRCLALLENEDGELEEIELQPGHGYTCHAGQRHRLIGLTDCEIVEISTPEVGTTWRLEDDYKRSDETPQQRSIERGEAGA